MSEETAVFIGGSIYRGSRYGARHPLAIERVPAVTDLSRALGWLPAHRYRVSPRAKPEAMMGFHDAGYLSALQKAEADQSVSDAVRERYGLGTVSNPIFPEMFRRPATSVGGGLLAAEILPRVGTVYHPGGGTHHGLRDRASGFCYLNEPVVTIQRLLARGLGPVVYIDIDAHHGDGVELAFDGAQDVRLISVHEAGRWPRTGAVSDTAGGAAWNVPVRPGFNDTEFEVVLQEVILPLVRGQGFGTIYLQCGADALHEDPLSKLALSNNAHARAVEVLRPLAPRMIVSGGGGYNPWSTARCWTRVWGVLSGQVMPTTLPTAAQEVLKSLAWPRAGRPAPELLTTLCDRPHAGAVSDSLHRTVEGLAVRVSREF